LFELVRIAPGRCLYCLADNEKPQQVFNDDLEQLFLGTPERSQPTFTRFVDAVTKCDFSKKENADNFRLALLNIMQRTIFYRIASISPYKTDRTVSDAIIGPEFGRDEPVLSKSILIG
jgi:hypothetical protein